MSRLKRHTHPITVLDDQGRTLWTGRPATDASWEEHAACRMGEAEEFFPTHGATGGRARGTCAGCPVRFACLEAAVSASAVDGIWGGLSATSRRFRQLRRDRLALAQALETGRGRP